MPPVELKDVITEVSDTRMEICNGCPFQSTNARELGTYKGFRNDVHCIQCGCPLAAKTKSLSSRCPIGRWEAVVSDEERYKLEKWGWKEEPITNEINENESNELQAGESVSTEGTSEDLSEPDVDNTPVSSPI